MQLRDQVPPAVGAVEAGNGRLATQRLDDGVDLIPLHGDRHQRADLLLLDVGFQANGIAHDGAVGLQPRHPVLHRAAGHSQFLGEGSDGGARIGAQQREQTVVEVIHRWHHSFSGPGPGL